MMLYTLRQIVQEVSAAGNLEEALSIIVTRVKEAMQVDVCSVYLASDDDGDYVLMATDGLNPDSVGEARLAIGEGIVGLVGEMQEPVNLEAASKHPRFRYFPEMGEEPYEAFLGVPVIHYRKVMGVLVVQQTNDRVFDRDEVAFLVTVAAQLAGAIAEVSTGSTINRLLEERAQSDTFIRGQRGAPGVAIGTVTLASVASDLLAVPDRDNSDAGEEEKVFRAAVAEVRKTLGENRDRMAAALPPDAQAVFDAYMMLLDEGSLIKDTVRRIHAGQWAPAALRDTVLEQSQVFEKMRDRYLRARAEDIRGIGRRILASLQAEAQVQRDYPDNCILVGEEVSVARIAEVPVEKLAGIVCLKGSVYSHTAVLARALGVPAVMGVGSLPLEHLEAAAMVVDGYRGRVFIRPSPTIVDEFQRLVEQDEALAEQLAGLRDQPAETTDGHRVCLYANTGFYSDIAPALAQGAEGIGLYRTEFTFMVRESFPGEDVQHEIYRRVLEALAPRPVTMRTLDIGGDKPLSYFPIEEDNPFLGWRGIRVTLDHPEIFLTQLRALLRAGAGLDNLRIMLPMVTTVGEVDESLELIDRAWRELEEHGEAPAKKPPVGAMIEVPSGIYMAGILAHRLDFIAVGTNDLTQYLLAVDRNNPRVADLYDPLHPAVIQAVHQVVSRVVAEDCPITVCGEMAGSPGGALLLLGMGARGLSISGPVIPRIKWVIRSFSQARAAALLEGALKLEDAGQVHELVNGALREAGLGELLTED